MQLSENKKIRNVYLPFISLNTYNIENKFSIVENVIDITKINEIYKIFFCAIICCKRGKAEFIINDQAFTIQKNDILVALPDSIIIQTSNSPDFIGNGLFFNKDMNRIIVYNKRREWEELLFIIKQPLLQLTDNEVDMFSKYYELILQKTKEEKLMYKYELICSLLSALFYDTANSMVRYKESIHEHAYTKQEEFFNKFIKLLLENVQEERSVQFYAEKLCITPKYLSALCKNVSGKNASEWIRDQVNEQIKSMLTNTTLSIKEITNILHFRNQSFFGRYVKQYMGCTPVSYRKKHVKQSKTSI